MIKTLVRLIDRFRPLTWAPPAPPAVTAPLETKLEWVEECNRRVSDYLGGGVIGVAQAFCAPHALMKMLAGSLQADMRLSQLKYDHKKRHAAIIRAIRKSIPDRQLRNLIFFYWQLIGDAYCLLRDDPGFARVVMSAEGQPYMEPHMFTNDVLSFLCSFNGWHGAAPSYYRARPYLAGSPPPPQPPHQPCPAANP